MTELVSAKRARASYQGHLKRHVDRFNERKDQMDFNACKAMLTAVEELEKKFLAMEEKIICLEAVEGEDVPDEIQVSAAFTKFMDDFESLRDELLTLVELKRPKAEVNSSGAGNGDSTSRSRLFHLPKLEIPRFSGDFTTWLDFRNEFESLVKGDDLSDIDRFRFLKTALAEGPKQIISSMEVSEENYKKAWKALKERYDNKALIFRSHINAILSLQGVSGATAQQHRELLDKVRAHFRALTSLGTTENLAENLLICIMLQKLDQNTQAKWEEHTDEEIATWDQFTCFYEGYASTLERVHQAKRLNSKPASVSVQGSRQQPGKKPQTVLMTSNVKDVCPRCKSDHVLINCPAFLALAPQARRYALKGLKICWKCLSKCSNFKSCPVRCGKCEKGHNFLLHVDQPEPKGETSGNDSAFKTPQTSPSNNPQGTSTPINQAMLVGNHLTESALIGSVMVDVINDFGDRICVHALLDSGSTINIASERLARMVNAPITRKRSPIGGISNLVANVSGVCLIKIGSRVTDDTYHVHASTMSRITDSYPPLPFDISQWELPSNVQLANPNFNKPQRVDLLIGAGLFWHLIENERLSIGPELPMCQKTKLGWIIVGNLPTSCASQKVLTLNSTLESQEETLYDLVERFWKIDSFENEDDTRLSQADEFCEDLFKSTTRRDATGRFVVQLPFKPEAPPLGRSATTAKQRFLNLERRLHKNPQLLQMYSDFIDEYERLGHLERVCELDYESPHYFIPHHCVLKPTSSTTKLRVVFDASCKTSNGLSLNDALYPGPKIQEDLFVTLLRFRLFKYVATVDIVKMYRQTLIDSTQTNFQLIYWRKSPTDPLQILRLRTVTYGTAPGAFLAIRALQQLAYDEANDFPLGAKLLLNSFYVDDGLVGFDSISELERALEELKAILARAGMSLGKYCSNSTDILSKIPVELHEKCLRIDEHQIIKTLGLLWQPTNDAFHYCSEVVSLESNTKRKILSQIARIFDPLGLICPIVTLAKIFYQDLWKLKLDWDDLLPDSLVQKWADFCTQLSELKHLSIPRYVIGGTDIEFVELHGFSDASEKAYGACVYLRSLHRNGTFQSRLFCSKSRVAPTKTLSIARLELCAAKLLVDLAGRVKQKVLRDFPIKSQYLWSDSQIVLCWIKSEPSRWSSFVSHRVAKIQQVTSLDDWHHIPGENNPADLVSRGSFPKELAESSLWWHGPSFLSDPQEMWPETFVMNGLSDDLEEARATKFALLTASEPDLTQTMHFSTGFRGTRRAFAYALRFIRNLKARCCEARRRKAAGIQAAEKPQILINYDEIPIPSNLDEIIAEMQFLKDIQRSAFKAEIAALERDKPLPANSPIRQLSPFLEDGMLRVGGRLSKARLSHDAKHQILLPKDHPYTNKVFFYFHHFRAFHGGAQKTLAAVRCRYWPVRGLVTARKICFGCVWCFRTNPRFITQLMGGLPVDRINPKEERPFHVTGVDFAGPFVVRHHARCKQPKKAYLALFICFATKAVHVDLVNDLSTDAFLRALRRFVADHGVVAKIFSDNGTNFRGAANLLAEIKATLERSEKEIREACSGLHIEWSFIPPRMPNYGGLWESAIKSLKKLVVNIAGRLNLTEDELRTVARQAAAVMNSRPITTLSSDPCDLEPLTPGHFLYGGPAAALPEAPIVIKDGNINAVHVAQRMAVANRQIWQRFHDEYLALLQPRTKWLCRSNALVPGTVVLLREDNLPPLKWPLGRIIEVIPSSDDNTRVVKVKTTTGELIRGINRVAPLPLHGGEDVHDWQR